MAGLKDEEFEMVCASVRTLVVHLVEVDRLPLSAVLSVIHAEILSGIAGAYGGAVAAQCARRAADRVEALPSLDEYVAENPLAGMQCRGRA